MRLHMLTAVTRPENLAAMAESFRPAGPAGVDLVWHIRFDPERRHVGGQALKNAMIDTIADGWVWIGDDDNVAHPDFFRAARAAADSHPEARMLVIPQRTAAGIRPVHRGMIRASHIDAAQAVIRRDAIGDHRIPLNYCGDGEFLEAVADGLMESEIAYLREPVVMYNALRGGQA